LCRRCSETRALCAFPQAARASGLSGLRIRKLYAMFAALCYAVFMAVSSKHRRQTAQTAAVALASALEPFVDLCLELGITSPEMERVLRAVFVRRAQQLLSGSSRRARSASDIRIGLMIGVHRNFVRQIRTTRPRVQLEKVQHRHRGSALLQAWASDWQFLTTAGHPRDLSIRGTPGEPSFETLVRRHMSGVSTGTAIAELRRSGAVRLLPDERIRLRSRTALPPGITSSSIATVGEHLRDLAATLLHNLRTLEDQRFCESIDELQVDPQRLAFVRQMIAKRARTFIDALVGELNDEAAKAVTPDSKAKPVRIGLTICAHENSLPAAQTADRALKARKAGVG
jgi:hypothetical protein